LITDAWRACKNNDFTLARDHQAKIFYVSQAIYGVGEPSGDAHARMKEVLKQRGLFTSALMRLPILPLNKNELQGVTDGLKEAGVPKVNL
jgi:4-hydroxy-tetrahydrodipicolinate synthase